MISVVTQSVEATHAFAERIGEVVRGGDIFELVSDVGGGKTTFAKGLARGMQVEEVVQSPTFTISRIYHARDGLELHHFDFYRLQAAGVVAAELAESLAQSNAVVVVEWGDIVHDVFPAERITVAIKASTETARQFEFEIPATYSHILDAINHYKGSSILT
jgi:tRNA threonylcarbamoyladenosine biosynthesis protein TsaE